LQNELERARTDLEDRKTLDRAKGILMKNKGLTEDEAYRLMRGAAMRENKKIADIAHAIVTAAELLK
jgi:response regulator NasT